VPGRASRTGLLDDLVTRETATASFHEADVSMRYSLLMKRRMSMTRISRGGQVTVPAPIRRRWETERVVLEDHDDYLVLRPVADPVAGFIGFAAAPGRPTSEELRARSRAEETAAENRRR
jgi:bifunctional DNA-binding transcriptional regulator/antitoxin component of YhaV-PrlF toxin-antitoxin module